MSMRWLRAEDPIVVTLDWLIQVTRVWRLLPTCFICGAKFRVGDVVRWESRPKSRLDRDCFAVAHDRCINNVKKR